MAVKATRRKRFLPFENAGHRGALVVEEVRVDGQVVPHVVHPHSVDLEDVTIREHLELDLAYAVPDEAWETLPEDERDHEAIRVVWLAEDPATWLREAGRLEPRDGDYRARLRLEREDLGEVITLRCLVTRARTREELHGLASERGARLCGSPPIVVRLQEVSQTTGSFMSIQWHPFSELSLVRAATGVPYFLQLDENPPVLWLNSELADMKEVLTSNARTGRRRAVREVLNHAIATSAWSALFHNAALGVAEAEDGVTYREDWHENVLRLVARHAYVQLPKTQRLKQLEQRILDARERPEQWAVLQQEVALGLARWMELGTSFERAARELA